MGANWELIKGARKLRKINRKLKRDPMLKARYEIALKEEYGTDKDEEILQKVRNNAYEINKLIAIFEEVKKG